MAKKNHSATSKATRQHSTMEEHHRQGKTFTPPLAVIPNMKFASWRNDRLPETLWCILLVVQLPRNQALGTIRDLAELITRVRESKPALYDITHTGLAQLDDDTRMQALRVIVARDDQRDALRPLLLLEGIPARGSWEEVIGTPDENWEPLMLAVAKTLDHQSQESTDCRWARVVCMMAARKLHLSSKELAKEILYYPEYGDMRKVRPLIRATEVNLDALIEPTRDWAPKFWAQCFANTNCFALPSALPPLIPVIGTTLAQVTEVYELLTEHFYKTVTTTAIDAQHDTVFGLALYCLSILLELLRVGASQSVTGRIALRTIVECFITLAYLATKNDPELWKSYRVFGAGQAKLQYLKLEELDNKPTYVETETLQSLANEDMWEEFLGIELGHWENANLRSIAIEANQKEVYDQFYAWSSSFAHGHWGSIRDTVFDTCGNPVHRLHRIPRESARALPDVIPDACALTDKVLEIVSKCYPEFFPRTTIQA